MSMGPADTWSICLTFGGELRLTSSSECTVPAFLRRMRGIRASLHGARRENDFLAEAKEKGLRFYRLGIITGGISPTRTLKEGDASMDLSQVSISARDYGSVEEYLFELRRLVEGLAGRSAEGVAT